VVSIVPFIQPTCTAEFSLLPLAGKSSLFQGNETTDEKGTVDMADIVADDVCTRVVKV
jgi:hypothetical protein